MEAHQSHAATTTTSTRSVFLDKTMLKRKECILKMAEILFCILGLICVACTRNPYVSEAGFSYFCLSGGAIMAVILLGLYVTHIRDKIAPTLRLNFIEMVYSAVWCFFFVASAIANFVFAGKYEGNSGLMVAGIFGCVLAVLYAIEALIMLRAWRTGATMSATQTTTTRQVA